MKPTRRQPFVALVLLLALVAGATACGSDDKKESTSTSAKKVTVRIAPQEFSEDETLSQVYGQYLKSKGYNVDVQRPSSAFRKGVYPALQSGKADLTIDYTGSAASEFDKTGKPSPDPAQTYTRFQAALKKAYPTLTGLDYTKKAEDKNAFVVLKTFADKNNLKTISDVKKVENQVTFGGSPQCSERTDCLLGYQNVYGLKFKATKVITYGPPLVAGLESNDLQAVQYQTTAPEIAKGDLVVLEEDKGIFSADNVVPVITSKLAANQDLVKAINTLTTKITSKDLLAWNVSTDIDKEDPAQVATTWLKDQGLT
jgi:osmoprotectant transport system substrate-binding protein